MSDCGKQFASSVSKLARPLRSLKYCMDLKSSLQRGNIPNKGISHHITYKDICNYYKDTYIIKIYIYYKDIYIL